MRDLQWRRAQFPALDRGVAYLDGPGGSQVPTTVVDAISQALRSSMSNVGWGYQDSERSERAVVEARRAIGDLLGTDANAVAFGGSMTALTYRISAAMARGWRRGDEVIVTELDHDANVRPWVQAAEEKGAVVRWAQVTPETCELPVNEFERLVSDRTKLVALTAASNAIGTRPDIRSIARIANDVGAVVYLDAVHAVPHGPVTLAATGADIIACSAYKFFGPHIGCVASTPDVLATIEPLRLAPATDRIPDRFELGTLPFEQLAGVTAAVDFLSCLSEDDGESRRDRLARTMAEIDAYCSRLFDRLKDRLRDLPGVDVIGPDGPRAPTLCFTVQGYRPREVAVHLASLGLNVSSGNFYAYELMRRLGLYDHGGAVRIGLLHYNSIAEIDRLCSGVRELTRATRL